jgi:hypothetical protein
MDLKWGGAEVCDGVLSIEMDALVEDQFKFDILSDELWNVDKVAELLVSLKRVSQFLTWCLYIYFFNLFL